MRRVDKERLIILQNQDSAKLNTPVWMWDSWVKAYGADATRKIAESHLKIPNIDLTAKSEPKFWADKLHGHLLSTGSIRLNSPGDPSNLDGFKQGSWWIQDAGASIPVQLFGNNIKGKTIADLCAAPGGKTAQLAAAQAKVIAIDKNESRLETLRKNLKRLRLTSEIICTDALDWRPKKLLDGVLIDAPCTATGTIRRHPDIKHLKKRDDVLKAQKLQLKLLEAASKMITKKGQMVFSTCSLQPEEGEQVVNIFLSQNLGWQRKPFESNLIKIFNKFITKSGDIRTLPFHFIMGDHTQKKPIPSGIDGFFSTCLIRK